MLNKIHNKLFMKIDIYLLSLCMCFILAGAGTVVMIGSMGVKGPPHYGTPGCACACYCSETGCQCLQDADMPDNAKIDTLQIVSDMRDQIDHTYVTMSNLQYELDLSKASRLKAMLE